MEKKNNLIETTGSITIHFAIQQKYNINVDIFGRGNSTQLFAYIK